LAFTSSSDIETPPVKIWNELAFDEVARVFHERERQFEWVVGDAGEYCHESTKTLFRLFTGVRNRARGLDIADNHQRVDSADISLPRHQR
jgi:hypothetical protein